MNALSSNSLEVTTVPRIMGQHDHQEEEVVCEVFSEKSLSRSNSVDNLSLHHFDDGSVEERFRVDRRKLEAMLLGMSLSLYFRRAYCLGVLCYFSLCLVVS